MSGFGVVVFCLKGMRLAECLKSVEWADAVEVLPVNGPAMPREAVKGIKTGWVLHLWGDERVGEELREELCRLREGEFPPGPGYRIRIRSVVLGRWVEGSLWGPSPGLRLRHKIEEIPGWLEGERAEGARLLSRGWIEDHSLAQLSQGIDRINAFSSFWAEALERRAEKINFKALPFASARVFGRLLWMNRIFANGLAGLTISILAAYATLLAGAKLWERRHSRRTSPKLEIRNL